MRQNNRDQLINGLIPHYYEGVLSGSVVVNSLDVKCAFVRNSKNGRVCVPESLVMILIMDTPAKLVLAVKIWACQRMRYTDG